MGDNNKARKVVLSVEYADDANADCNVGISLLAKMMLQYMKNIVNNASSFLMPGQPIDEKLIAEFLDSETFNFSMLPDINKDSVIVCDRCDAKYWVSKMMEA